MPVEALRSGDPITDVHGGGEHYKVLESKYVCDGCVVLEGHVHLKCHTDGHHAEVAADHVCVRLADMAIQVSGHTSGPVMPASYEEGWRFWPGFLP